MERPKPADTTASTATSTRPDAGAKPQTVSLQTEVAATTVAMKAAPTPSTRRWDLSDRDKTLRAVVERWAADAGWRTFWELDVDYPITATASIDGNFEEAVATVVRSMDQADVPLKAIFYRGNQVLRMVPRGME